MSNPLITVISALYGAAGAAIVDITAQTQAVFDTQYNNNPNLKAFSLTNISPPLFNIPDPDPNQVKTFTIVYSIGSGSSGEEFMRGGKDGDTLELVVLPAGGLTIARAIYATNAMGIDLTDALAAYVADPGNCPPVLVVGSQAFLSALTGGGDPRAGLTGYFSVVYYVGSSQTPSQVCGFDGQSVSID